MANLDAASDRAVHDAVDAYMEGRLTPEFSGETVFETKNSRYRLLDGVVFAAPDDSLIGAELVGWLMETSRRSVVGSAWQPGSRAVLVDRHRGRHIIVTSTTRLLHLEEHISNDAPTLRPPALASPAPIAMGLPDRPAPDPHFARAPIVPATPLPGGVRPSPAPSAAALQKRAAAVHLPPRLIIPTPSPTPLPVTRPPAAMPAPARPLPLPAPPPRREATPFPQVHVPPPVHVPPVHVPPVSAAPPAETPWELASSEFEIDPEAAPSEPTDDVPTRLDAPRYDTLPDDLPSFDDGDQPTGDPLADPESATDAPIPLVRPIDPGGHRRR